jgi:hypothetical protein
MAEELRDEYAEVTPLPSEYLSTLVVPGRLGVVSAGGAR